MIIQLAVLRHRCIDGFSGTIRLGLSMLIPIVNGLLIRSFLWGKSNTTRWRPISREADWNRDLEIRVRGYLLANHGFDFKQLQIQSGLPVIPGARFMRKSANLFCPAVRSVGVGRKSDYGNSVYRLFDRAVSR
ncbi:MAG TPA: hypothetical protein DDW52_26140 [Planctomycetaceae bacterium]|nr:hypothetical protein [Planctomycetaceae bacterium]